MEERRRKLGRASQIALLSAPLAVFSSIMVWFSINPIAPVPGVEASVANPSGLLTSNFVYDGSINVENIVVSCAFLLVLCLYLPKRVDMYMVYVLPVGAVVAGGLGELTAISGPYASPSVCGQGCSFYGMSGVASAIVGFTFAGFFIVFGLTILQVSGKLAPLTRMPTLRTEILLVSTFVTYVLLLLLISGIIALPSHPTPGSPGGGAPVPPPAILTESPPVALVHTASLLYGFLVCLITFVLVSRRYRLLTLRV